MAYIGNSPVAGENNSFKILDDISTYTLTFDGSSSSVVSTSDNTITYNSHRFITAQRVTYNDGGGTAIGGLADGVYYIIKNDQNTIKLAASVSDANAGTAISLTSLGVGSSHTLNVAFDGVNTKFKATYDNGTKAEISRAAQLTLSVNGVIQQPNDSTTPTNGFGFDLDSVIIFSVAPAATDAFWGNLVANNFPTFDISDNTIDNFTGDNSTVDFTLSKTPANNQNILVTLDGVIQYPSDANNTRAYSVTNNILTFVSAPGNSVAIQVRHIGFAGAVTSAVTGFYGRTGNVGLSTSDNAEVLTLKVGTGTTFTEDLVVQGDARVTGILTIGTASLTLDGTNNQIKIGTGITLTESGGAEYSGVITATTFNGDVKVATGSTISGGTNYITASTNGSERIRIDSSGNFGIGTTSPSALVEANGGNVRMVDTNGSIYLQNGNTTNGAKIGVRGTSDATDGYLAFETNSIEFARFDSSGNFGLGTANPSEKLDVSGTGDIKAAIQTTSTGTGANAALRLKTGNYNWLLQTGDTVGGGLRFFDSTNSAERLRISGAGEVKIGGNIPQNYGQAYGYMLAIRGPASAGQTFISIPAPGQTADSQGLIIGTDINSSVVWQRDAKYLGFATNNTERLRIHADGIIDIAKFGGSTPNTLGTYINPAPGGHYHVVHTHTATGSANSIMYLNRQSSDGQLIQFRQGNVSEGSISVSGSTVSYNGAHLSRWSQLSGNAAPIEILRGSVLSNLDEMCEWAYDAEEEVLWTEDDELPEGVNVGDVKTPAKDAGTEDNEQLNRMKVSDVEGDRNVAGVFDVWDDDPVYTNDFYCAMTGDFIIRIAQGVTVERGDLLMSAGDGTAKPQEDDIIRSKTIAKVTSTNVSCTYDDGSYCVPCVLMAC